MGTSSDPDSNGWPECCYWGPLWQLTCSILLATYLTFFGFNLFCLWRLRSTKGKFHCKKFFHQSSVVQTGVRITQLIFLILGNSAWPHTSEVYYFARILTYLGAYLFALVFCAVIAFWFTFYIQTKYGDYFSTTKYNHRLKIYIIANVIFFLAVSAIDIFFSIYAKVVLSHSFIFVQTVFLTFLAIILILEGVAFFVVGILLYYALKDPTSFVNLQVSLSNRALQIVLLAILLFVIMSVRAILLTKESIDLTTGFKIDGQTYSERPYDADDSDHMFMGKGLSWWYYLIYYFFGECFPLCIMTIFQSRLPKSEKSVIKDSLFSKGDETIQLRPSSGDEIDSYDED